MQGVELNRLVLEMRSLQAEARAQAQPSVAAPANVPSFAEMLGQAVGQVHQNQQVSTKLAEAFEMGAKGVDLSDVMIASQKASVSFQAAVQVRNKLVQAYQDIMQMPV